MRTIEELLAVISKKDNEIASLEAQRNALQDEIYAATMAAEMHTHTYSIVGVDPFGETIEEEMPISDIVKNLCIDLDHIISDLAKLEDNVEELKFEEYNTGLKTALYICQELAANATNHFHLEAYTKVEQSLFALIK